MDKVTVTLFIKPNGLMTLISVLKILDGLELENDYVFNPIDIEYSETFVSTHNQVNVPVELYLKFRYSYNKNKK